MHQIKPLNRQPYVPCNQGKCLPKNKDIMHQENCLCDSQQLLLSHPLIMPWHLVFAIEILCLAIQSLRCRRTYCSPMNHLHNAGRRNLLTITMMLKMMMGMIIKSLMCSCSFILRRCLLWYSVKGFNGQFLKRWTFSFESEKDIFPLKCQDIEKVW